LDEDMKHPEKTRVVLTHTDHEGRSGLTDHVVETLVEADASGTPVFRVSQLWGTPDNVGVVGPGENPEQVFDPWYPGPGGVRFRFFTFEPLSRSDANDFATPQLQDVSSEAGSGFIEAFDPERPGMHISDTVDFVHILDGEIILELERNETLVRKGDVVIMRGGWHNWRNETDRPCTVASVMVGAKRL
jgi:mannose-6-phosphate isomerase-like protein (cupin superfamily)